MSDEKPLPPSEKKLRDARKRGEIVKSQEVTQVASLMVLLAYAWLAGSQILDTFTRLFQLLEELRSDRFQAEGLVWFITEAFTRSAVLLLLLGLLPVVFGIVAGLLQSRWLISFEPLAPKFERLNPGQNLKNMFTLTKVADVVRRLLKSLLILLAVWWLGKRVLSASVQATDWPTPAVAAFMTHSMLELATLAAAILLLGAVVDYVLQRVEFFKQQGMSLDDVKREHKQMEGDPYLQSKRKALHREMAMTKMADRAKRARVLITNPNHVAIALQYGEQFVNAPVVIAKGLDQVALNMKTAAKASGVPIYEDISLARRLFRLVEVDAAIGPELFEPVAEVLIWVEKLTASQPVKPSKVESPSS